MAEVRLVDSWKSLVQNPFYQQEQLYHSFTFYNANVPQNLSDEEPEAVDRLSKNKNLVIQKADKGNSVVLVDRDVYVKHMENILKDNIKLM